MIPPILTHLLIPDLTVALPVGGAVPAAFTAYEADWYAVNLAKGSTYLFAARGMLDGGGTLTWQWPASVLTLVDASGKILDQIHEDPLIGRAALAFAPGTDGIYYLRASGMILGSYTMAANEVAVDDWLAGPLDGSRLNAGAGLDTVVYDGALSDYTVVRSGPDFGISRAGGGGATLANVERVHFAGTQALALDVDGAAGAAYRLYRAAFDRAPDQAGVGFWLQEMDHGMPLGVLARHFVMSAEFSALYGAASSDADFVTQLYSNIFDRAGDQAGVDFWLHALEQGVSRADVLASFSESAENVAAAALLIGNGFAYIPYTT
ncbi:MAG: DUF4214 domain-containing protein [Pseudomonadota bacterium]